MKVLFINACVRKNSRTLVLAREFMKEYDAEITELNLEMENISPLNGELLEKRDSLLHSGAFDDPSLCYARQFAAADEIVIAAPFWDLSFPAMLKTYFERITASGITFEYVNGRPVGLCRAHRLVYVTTSGGEIFEDFGYTYVRTLAKSFYGIPKTLCVRATNLDVEMITADRVLADAKITTVE